MNWQTEEPADEGLYLLQEPGRTYPAMLYIEPRTGGLLLARTIQDSVDGDIPSRRLWDLRHPHFAPPAGSLWLGPLPLAQASAEGIRGNDTATPA